MIIKTSKLFTILVGIVFFLSLLTNVRILQLVAIGNADVYLFHVFCALFLLLVLCKMQLIFPPVYLNIYFLCILMISLISGFFFGYTGHLLNIILNFFIIVSICSFNKHISTASWEKVFVFIGIVYLVLIDINLLLNFRYVINSLLSLHRVWYIFTFSDGGSNLDSAWLAILSLFFLKKRFGFVFWINSMLVAFIFASRTGVILNVLSFLFMLRYLKFKRNILIMLFSFLAIIVIFFALQYEYNIIGATLMRFFSIGDEIGSVSRLVMWGKFNVAFFDNVLGYGAGNAVSIINNYLVYKVNCQAIHNIYLQAFLDFGFVGGIYHLMLVCYLFYREFKNKFQSVFGQALILYFVAGLFQFSGVEIQLAIILGIYLCERKNQIIETKQLHQE